MLGGQPQCHSDSGGEYLGDAFDKPLVASGTVCRLTFLKGTLVAKMQALPHTAALPQGVWGRGPATLDLTENPYVYAGSLWVHELDSSKLNPRGREGGWILMATACTGQ
jgi:hypothetical protein